MTNTTPTPETSAQDYDQPVAYDANGQPLYARPAAKEEDQQVQQPQIVHIARSVQPEKMVVTPETQKRHDRSKRLYPMLNLSEGEYVISAVRRHPIGLFAPLAGGVLAIGLSLSLLVNYDIFVELMSITGPLADINSVAGPILLLCLILALGMFIAIYVYVHNRFFLTNESVVQEIQHTLFSRHEQTVSLASIEDASFTQHGIFQQVFNYGDIRLSTEGDETTYRFTYVAQPRAHIAQLNDAVEAFKNGRPVGD